MNNTNNGTNEISTISSAPITSILVLIVVNGTTPADKNIEYIRGTYFNNPLFNVQIFNGVDIKDDNELMLQALTFAAMGPYISDENGFNTPQYYWAKLPCIIIRDTSISNLMGVQMRSRILTAMDAAKQADLIYLCKWQDKCELYKNIRQSIDDGSGLKWSSKPNATQAILYRPVARDTTIESFSRVKNEMSLGEFLNEYIEKGYFLAVVFSPNIVDYDINLADNNKEYNKLNECAPVAAPNPNPGGGSTLIWFILVVLLVLIIAWAALQLGKKY